MVGEPCPLRATWRLSKGYMRKIFLGFLSIGVLSTLMLAIAFTVMIFVIGYEQGVKWTCWLAGSFFLLPYTLVRALMYSYEGFLFKQIWEASDNRQDGNHEEIKSP